MNNNELIKCSICLDDIDKNSISLTKCAHLYCYECLKSCRFVDKRCPKCRKTLQEDDIILIHYNDTNNYNILDNKKQVISNEYDEESIVLIQRLIRREMRRGDYPNFQSIRNQNENNLRRTRMLHLNEIQRQNITIRRYIRNYDNNLLLLENNLITNMNISSIQNVLRDIHLEQLYSVVNHYSVDRRIYLNSISQRDRIIQIQKNLIDALKNHVSCLNDYINIQNSLIDSNDLEN